MKRLFFPSAVFILLGTLATADAQNLRRPGVVTIKREDRSQSQLVKEDGAIYLEGMVDREIKVRVFKQAPAYSTLSADRFLGNVAPNQNATLLAVSDKAYRIRAIAAQGQIAGWISKAAVSGLPDQFEENLTKYYERYLVVKDLIENNQVALGMTVEEVMASIGPPDRRTSRVEKTGRTDLLEYVTYERVPQTFTSYNSFGLPVTSTRYVEVESGRVTLEFQNNLVSSIEESEGINWSGNGSHVLVPSPIFLF